MKNKVWLFQIPLVALFSFAFWVAESGIEGSLRDPFLRTSVFPVLQAVSGIVTNIKFRIRGPVPAREKVAIVEIDSTSIEQYGRWPWHRDHTAKLIDAVFNAGAKTVGLDMVFSEPDLRVPDGLVNLLVENNLGHVIQNFETDLQLKDMVEKYKDRLTLGWTTENACQPVHELAEACPVADPEYIKSHPENHQKFGFTRVNLPSNFEQTKTPILSFASFITNMELYNQFALHSGYFSANPDADGYIRRTSIVMFANSQPYPSLALEMARVALGEDLEIDITSDLRVKNIKFAKSGRAVPVSPLGTMEINFRGAGNTFPYISASEMLFEGEEINPQIQGYRRVASTKTDMIKDAHVLIGVTALGVHDMRAFPFDSNTAGVEGHANILDNILAADMIVHSTAVFSSFWILMIMIVGALLFAFFTEKMNAVPALILFILATGGFTFFDLKILFENNNINWNTGFLYLELVSIFMFTLAVKYVMEERNKKFIKGAFAKYVAPAIVDSMLKDPEKLQVGGEKREMTILFSDIRSFTTFSERLDPKVLSQFLNEYLGLMVEIVFEMKGNIDKFIGDAVMAYWGAPIDQPDHAVLAANAAVKMQQVLTANRERFKQQYGVDVNIGVGLNSGIVSVGNMGCDRIFSYTSLGDEVNLASRVESLTKYYGVGTLATRATVEHCEKTGVSAPSYRSLDFVKVKGKKNAVELVELLETALNPEGLKIFQEARDLYRKRQWDQAVERFMEANSLLQKSPDQMDGPTEMYIDRCKELKENPPGTDWDGSWEMHSK